MAKNYHPSIKEFHVGFEYEYLDYPYKWKKITLTEDMVIKPIEGDYDTTQPFIPKSDLSMFRVKYLDKEDIESLGGINIQEDTYEFPYKDPRGYNDKLHIITRGRLNWVLICVGNDEKPYSDWNTIFAGEIRNKSELIRVLKMVGIPQK